MRVMCEFNSYTRVSGEETATVRALLHYHFHFLFPVSHIYAFGPSFLLHELIASHSVDWIYFHLHETTKIRTEINEIKNIQGPYARL